jgi:ribosomal protein L7/L12
MNYYASVIDQLEQLNGEAQLRSIAVDYAKRHPKAFLHAVGEITTDWKVEARKLYVSGNKISAIKHCRSLTGMSLYEAKDAVEALE